jgi:hypothetical protein
MSVTLSFGAALLGGMVAAAVLHELTHAAAVRLVGGKVEGLSLRRLYVDWRVDDATRWQVRAISLAPQCVGVSVALAALVVGIPSGRAGIVAAASWAVYTLLGGRADFSLARAQEVRQ